VGVELADRDFDRSGSDSAGCGGKVDREGSVRTAGNQLRITAQLIDAVDGSHVWSRAFDRERNDVFAIQEEIATAVSETLSVSLDIGAMARARGGTTTLQAYDMYLQPIVDR
jgi:hypothetical protein